MTTNTKSSNSKLTGLFDGMADLFRRKPSAQAAAEDRPSATNFEAAAQELSGALKDLQDQIVRQREAQVSRSPAPPAVLRS